MKNFFAKVWEHIKAEWKKYLKYAAVAIPLIIVTFIGYKYVKNKDSFLQKKDVDKAKEKIKTARDTVVISKDIRKKAESEVMKVQAKAKVRYSDYEKSADKVEELEEISHQIEKDLARRKETTGHLIKKKD